jgi:hypothetical protein
MAAMKYIISFTVISKKPFNDFPIDMLRYDRCFPATDEDALNISTRILIDGEEKEPVRVKLLKYAETKETGFQISHSRWESFGWTVVEEDVNKI